MAMSDVCGGSEEQLGDKGVEPQPETAKGNTQSKDEAAQSGGGENEV